MSELIRVERRPGFCIVVLDRADKMNALTAAMIHQLIATLNDAEADPSCRALVLTGTGRAFCAGADLAGITPDADLAALVEHSWNPLARKLHHLRMPSIAAVNGMAAGAGANLALGCDIVLAGHSAKFLQAFSKIGLVPDCGGSWHLPRLIGIGRARALAMLAEPVPATEAAAMGMIWRAVSDERVMDEAEALATRLASLPTQALLLTRQEFAASTSNSFEQQLALERDLQGVAGRTPDFREGMRAFLEKRPPVFAGRPA